jgi:hypothetical protein
MASPMCLRCKLPMVFLHQTKATDVRPNRNVFECRSCFVIVSEPIGYVLKAE